MLSVTSALAGFGLAACLLSQPAPAAGQTVRVLLISGQNNHDWQYTSEEHKRTLESTGRFAVDITTMPAVTLADSRRLKDYQVFFLDYNGPRWGDTAEKNFAEAVSGGTGVVCVHAANNAFVGWAEYEKMIGLLWIANTTGHGNFHSFDVTYTDRQHPITQGLADMKAHPDELYHKLVNVQKADFKVLATAHSSTASGGTGRDEPMALVLGYGKGRVFHTPLGHVWPGTPEQRVSITDPQFKVLLARGTEWAATGKVTIAPDWGGQPAKEEKPVKDKNTGGAPNTLSDTEKSQGWVLLFDGASTGRFRGFKKDAFPAQGWEVADGTIHIKAKGNGGDIITRDQYEDFEFACDWKVAPGGNSGIMYLCTEEGFDYPWRTGPEMQILDDKGHADGKDPKTSAGSLYALIACSKQTVNPAGEWNSARVVKKGRHIEHWLNGSKVVEYELGSPEWKSLVQASKFKGMPDYGTRNKGHIALQDHGDDVWFRNIKVRVIK